MPTSAAIYTRISKDPTGTGLGVSRQEEDCRALAEARGWVVEHVYCDNDVSAYDRRRVRPAYEELLRDLESGVVDGLVAYHSDRLYRQPADLERLINVIELARVPIAVVAEGDIDLSHATGRGLARVIGSFNRMQSERSSERIRRKHLELAQAGRPTGGARAYGYERDGMTIVETEAEVIRELAERLLAGESTTTLASELNARRVPSAQGGRWYASTLTKVMEGPRIAGLRQHHESIYPAAWPAIIALETHTALKRRLEPRPGRRRPTKHPLSGGLLRCGNCGFPMAGTHRQGKAVYICNGTRAGACGRRSRQAKKLEAYVLAEVLKRVDGPDLAEAMAEPDDLELREADESLGAVDERLAVLADSWASGELTDVEWRAARSRLTDERDRLMRIVHVVDRPELDAGVLQSAWPGLNTQQRRAVLGEVIEHIVVHRATPSGRTFDPSTVQILWRDQRQEKHSG